MRIESLTRLDEPSAGHLKQILLVLAAMQETTGESLGQPKMGTNDVVDDLLPSDRTRGLGLKKEVLSMFGEFFS